MTTEINIDYYHEIKGKADMWDKKETPLQVVISFRDDAQDGSRYQVYLCTKCGRMVSKNSNYCHNCGQMLLWEV